jgi:CCR4-NOT transcriptional regulation complex NOT5 subunit
MFEDTEDLVEELQHRVRNVRRKITAQNHKCDVFIQQHNEAIKDLCYDLSFYKGILDQFGAPEDDVDTFYSPLPDENSPNLSNFKHEDGTKYKAVGESIAAESNQENYSSYAAIGRNIAAANTNTRDNNNNVATGQMDTYTVTNNSVTSTIADQSYDLVNHQEYNGNRYVTLQHMTSPRRSNRIASNAAQGSTENVRVITSPPSQTKKELIQEERDKARAWFIDRQNDKKKKGT